MGTTLSWDEPRMFLAVWEDVSDGKTAWGTRVRS